MKNVNNEVSDPSRAELSKMKPVSQNRTSKYSIPAH